LPASISVSAAHFTSWASSTIPTGAAIPLVALVELARLVHLDRGLAGRADLHLALDQADDLFLRRGLAPEVGAADPGGDRGDADVDVAPALFRDRLGREAEGALQYAEGRRFRRA
jgi:hypothetical protein